MSLEDRVSHSLLHIEDTPSNISQVDLPGNDQVCFVYLSGDRLYTEADETLHVFSMNDLSSSIATYPLGGWCFSAIISDNRLYLGGGRKLHVY
jgi:hypothetical protein